MKERTDEASDTLRPLNVGATRARATAGAMEWVRGVLADGGSLYRAAAAHPDAVRLEGRGAVFMIPASPAPRAPTGSGAPAVSGAPPASGAPAAVPGAGPKARWVVRHYYRGGAVARVLGDRYLRVGTPRAFLEAEVSEVLRARGIRTPRVVAAAAYPAGMFMRGDLVTDFVPDAIELAELLFGEGGADSARRTAALRETGAFVRSLGAAGVFHPDLNAKNILLQWTETGSPRVILIDLDRCRVRGSDAGAPTMYRRLCRSLRKWETRSDARAALTLAEWGALASAFRR